jgi:uncharacterized phage protein (TIGR01671 family)
MNREIKFRAWDGTKMHYDFVVARPQFADVLGIMTDEEFAKTQYRLPMWKVMQYTGLKDKNGIGIWEGDILRGSFRTGMKGFKSTKEQDFCFPVKFYASSGWSMDTGFKNGKFRFIPHFDECETVGNIYQNRELLT